MYKDLQRGLSCGPLHDIMGAYRHILYIKIKISVSLIEIFVFVIDFCLLELPCRKNEGHGKFQRKRQRP